MTRYSSNAVDAKGVVRTGYDYNIQAWVAGYIVEKCGHRAPTDGCAACFWYGEDIRNIPGHERRETSEVDPPIMDERKFVKEVNSLLFDHCSMVGLSVWIMTLFLVSGAMDAGFPWWAGGMASLSLMAVFLLTALMGLRRGLRRLCEEWDFNNAEQTTPEG